MMKCRIGCRVGLCLTLSFAACGGQRTPSETGESEARAQRGTAPADVASETKAEAFSANPKPATSFTRRANDAIKGQLDFADARDFELARRGFIARPADPKVRDEAGKVVWDMEQYAFVQGDAPPTVNPSLWRQAQLNNNYGLFEVVEGIYQIRGLDLSNMTLVRGKSGWIVIDPLAAKETAAAAWQLVTQHLPRLPIKAVIYTHSHIDHFGGVKGVVSEEDVKSGKVRIYAPQGFMEAAISENVYTGTAMGRRAEYMYGPLLSRSPTGHVDAGLGKSTPDGTPTLITPTDTIATTGEKRTIDGVQVEFLMAPDSEAPAEMLFYFPEYKALCAAEDATPTLHNLYSLRGARVRDARKWSGYLHEALRRFGDKTEVVFASHHWPHWGQAAVVSFLEKQRDLYKYLHDQTLRMANQGATMTEIGESMVLPASLGREFYNRGYYGSVNHNVKAVYQMYLGWFDGNPANLHKLPPEEEAKRYVEAMGGEQRVLELGRAAFERGDYRWVASLVNHVVFANPQNREARYLQADALEQLGYQAESGPWRGFYLMGAQELREGTGTRKAVSPASPDLIRAMTIPMFLDYLATRVDGQRAAQKALKLNLAFTDTKENYVLELSNGVLLYTANAQRQDADATFVMTRETWDQLQLGQVELERAARQGDVRAQGNAAAWTELMSVMVEFDPKFPIVTP
jgi:alkyl sulfatase BDS1-like metallo-beta-lactamase superfamily hydrolase